MRARTLTTDVPGISLPGRRSARLRRLARAERGALAVEAALIIPIILIPLLFGIIEFSLLLRDKVTVTSMARNAARVAAASDPNDPANQTVPGFVTAVAQTVASSVPELPVGAMREIWIYQPVSGKNYPTNPPGATASNRFPNLSGTSGCGTNCIRLVWTQRVPAYTSTFGSPVGGGTWPSQTIGTCLPNMDNVGIYVKTTHKWFTGLFGGSLTVSDVAVMRFEPRDPPGCTP